MGLQLHWEIEAYKQLPANYYLYLCMNFQHARGVPPCNASLSCHVIVRSAWPSSMVQYGHIPLAVIHRLRSLR